MNAKLQRAKQPAPIPTPERLPVFEYQGRLVADSRDVAPFVEKDHKNLLRDIRRYVRVMEKSTGSKLSSLGKSSGPNLNPLDYFIERSYIDEKGETRPCFYCTEIGCELVAHKMKGDKGVIFTARYVKAFHVMRDELAQRRELRTVGKPIRRSLTDALRDSGEAERMHGHAYATYTNLAYTLSTGKNARQLRQERGADKDAIATDLLTSAELEIYQRKESAITVLLDAGLQYDTIKAVLCGGMTP